jgi:hypothetical protein
LKKRDCARNQVWVPRKADKIGRLDFWNSSGEMGEKCRENRGNSENLIVWKKIFLVSRFVEPGRAGSSTPAERVR